MITLIAAVSRNNVIGRDNKIPWYLPGDLSRFKHLTKQSDWYVMGRKSYESIVATLKDKSKEPLPGREKIILTRNTSFKAPHCTATTSPAFILNASRSGINVFIGGGEEIYKIFLPHADYLFLTRVHADVEGDTFFPEWNRDEWEWAYDPLNMIAETDPRDQYLWSIEDYRRK